MTSRRCCVYAILWIAALSPAALAAPASATGATTDPAALDEPAGLVRVRGFGGADGLHGSRILGIAQDGDGLLWLGTDDGVYRFNGEGFTRFTVADGLLELTSVVLGVAPDGNVCVGAGEGLVCWTGSRFSRAGAAGLPRSLVIAMAGAAGKLWVSVKGHGLYVRGPDSAFVPAPGWPGSSDSGLRALWADAGGVVAGNGTRVEISSGDGAWRDLGDIGLPDEGIAGVLRDHDGALWIRSQNHLWLLPRGQSRAIDLHAGLPTDFNALGAPVTMAIGPRGNVLIATDDGVAYRDGDRWRTIASDPGTPRLPLRTLLVDREGTIWLAGAGGGLAQLRGRGLVEHHTPADGLPGESVWQVERDRDGRMFIGTNRCLVHAIGRRWVCVAGTEGRFVTSLAFAPAGGMFVGGAPADLLYIDPTGRVQVLGERGAADHNIVALTLGPEGDLWIGRGDGLERLPGAVPGPIERVALPGGPGVAVASVVRVGERLWVVSATHGLFVREDGAWRRFGTSDGFRADAMAGLIARGDGRLCLTYETPYGLTCFRYEGRAIRDLANIGTADGLTSDSVNVLGEDRAHRLWIGSSDGVDIMTELAGGVVIDHLDEVDGLAGNNSSGAAMLLDHDGSLWIGANTGVSHVFAQSYRGPPAPPRTILLHGVLGDIALDARGPRAGLEVPHDRNALQLEVTTGSLVDAKRVEYQERLAPLEPGWTTARERTIRFPSLPPASYRFEVRARIDGGRWGPASQLTFTVVPAWWQTRWFLGFAAITALAGAGAAVSWRQRTMIQRRTRKLNERAAESFRAVVDLMPDLISVHRGRDLIYMNVAMQRLLGAERTAPLADQRWHVTDITDRLHPDHRSAAAAMLARMNELAAHEVSPITELMLRAADGSWRYLEVSGIRIEIGGVLSVVASGRDITERKRLQAKLLVSDRMASLGTLAAGIAHEINNPLAFVAGNLEVIEEALGEGAVRAADTTDRGAIVSALHDARDGAERVRKIVRGLRSFSRSDEEKRIPVELIGVLDAAIQMTANEVRHRARLVRKLGPVPLVLGDDGRLTQVFINLLINAAHAIHEGHSDANQITVRTRTDPGGNAVIEVEDTGKGMTPDVAARVFDPFFTTKDVGVGTGLGLSICHGIVSALAGQIAIESPPGGAGSDATGTLVRIILPPHAGHAAPRTAPTTEPRPRSESRRHRVMIVDDEPMVAHTMGRLLRNDCDVTIAQCGQEAIDHITGGNWFDAIVSDVMMPNMTGIELIEELRRRAPDQAQRLILLSGGAFTPEARARLEELGVPQLEKPISARDLRAWVMRIAGEAEAPEAPLRG